MYQGKFQADVRGHKSPDENLKNIIETRNAAKAAQAQKAAQTRKSAPAKPVQRPAANTAKPLAVNVPRTEPEVKPVKFQLPEAGAVRNTPKPIPDIAISEDIPAAPKAEKKKKKVKPEKKGPRVGSVIFYTLFFAYICAFFVGTYMGLQWLNGWLIRFEASQPTVKAQEVYDRYFADPNWNTLYDLAHVANTEYEGVDQFAAFMDEKMEGKTFDFVETSSGLSGDKKYYVRADGEKFASFTLEDHNKAGENDVDLSNLHLDSSLNLNALQSGEGEVPLPDWQLGKIELYFSRQQGYLIQKLDSHTAYVNGVALDDSFTIQTASTQAEKYLPLGVSGVRTSIQSITGLLMPPTVTIFDPVGKEMEVVYDEETGTFVEQTKETTITEAEKEAVLGAMKGYAEFMINASGSRSAVSKWFDTSSKIYNEILNMGKELWMNGDRGHTFHDERIDGYARYSDELFSVHAHIEMNVTLKNGGGQRDYPVDLSLFFKQKNGKWVCYDMTNEDVTIPVGQVRLSYYNGDELLSTGFVETQVKELMTPVISVPEGKVFSGWAKKTVSDTGKVTYTLVFVPDDDGLVVLNNANGLTPMTLYALIENA